MIFIVLRTIGAPLEHPGLVVQPLDEPQRYRVFQPAVGGDTVPVALDHRGKIRPPPHRPVRTTPSATVVTFHDSTRVNCPLATLPLPSLQ